MNFNLNKNSRQDIADNFLIKNKVIFDCLTHYDKVFSSAEKKLRVLFENGFSDVQVIESVLYHNVMNFIQNSYLPAVEKINLLLGLATKKYLFYTDDFSVLPGANKKYKFSFNKTTNRTELIRDVFIQMGMDINLNRSVPIQQTIDELTMNAQLNAPKHSPAKNIKNSLLITEKNENLVAITVIDNYGTLNTKKFLKKIENSLKIGRGESINFSRGGGAGLGGSIIYGHSDMILMGCVHLEITRITSVLPYNIAENKYSYIQKSISIIDQ